MGVGAFSSRAGPLVRPFPQDPQVFEGGGQGVAQEGRVGHITDQDDVVPCKRRCSDVAPAAPTAPACPGSRSCLCPSLAPVRPHTLPRCPAGGSGPSPWPVTWAQGEWRAPRCWWAARLSARILLKMLPVFLAEKEFIFSKMFFSAVTAGAMWPPGQLGAGAGGGGPGQEAACRWAREKGQHFPSCCL